MSHVQTKHERHGIILTAVRNADIVLNAARLSCELERLNYYFKHLIAFILTENNFCSIILPHQLLVRYVILAMLLKLLKCI